VGLAAPKPLGLVSTATAKVIAVRRTRLSPAETHRGSSQRNSGGPDFAAKIERTETQIPANDLLNHVPNESGFTRAITEGFLPYLINQ